MTHRGIFHTLVGSLIFAVPIGFMYDFYHGLALFLGYMSHLLLDSYTGMGVMWLYPRNKNYITFSRRKALIGLAIFLLIVYNI